jgi:DNA-binding transcriptional MerR regulator
MDLSIGALSKLTGISVKTIRYYSDIGLLPEESRTEAGYRRYDEEGLSRLELIRALRDLGFDIAATRRVADHQTTLEEVARAHVDAVDARIRQLKLRRAVLQAIAAGTARPMEVQRMTAFAEASADEARHIVEEFIDAVFADHESNPFAARMRAALPDLPDNPSDAQIDAWIELASLVKDESFRTTVREMIVAGEQHRETGGVSADEDGNQAAGQAVIDKGGAAIAAGITPTAAESRAVVAALVSGFAAAAGDTDTPAYRAELLTRLEQFSDRRVDRYWRLIGIINGWPAQPDAFAAYEWLIEALRSSLR